MSLRITVSRSLFVARPPEAVWDFTQDYARRCAWDASILEAVVVAAQPAPRVRIRARGGLRAVLQYQKFDRPSQTSLLMEDVRSTVVAGGGGSWSYAAQGEGTLWTQTNSIVMRPGWWRALLAPLARGQLEASTRRSMEKARTILESSAAG